MDDTSKSLPSTYIKGYCYFDVNSGKFWVDTKDNDSTGRLPLNAYKADRDSDGNLIKNSYIKTHTSSMQTISIANGTSSVPLALIGNTGVGGCTIRFATEQDGLLGELGIFQGYPTYKDSSGYKRLLTWDNFSINGAKPVGASTTFWAPTSSGSSGNLLVSRGSSYSPTWAEYLSNLNIGTISSNTGSQLLYGRLGNDGTSKYQANTYVSGGGIYYIDSITDGTTKNRFWVSATETGSTIPINAARGLISAANNKLYLEPGDNEVAMLTVYTNGVKAYGIHRNSDSNSLKVHYYTNGTWAAGYTLLDENNYSNHALPISGGSMQGQIWFNGDFSYPGIWFRNPDNNKNIGAVYMNPAANNYMHIRWARDDGGGDGYYYLNGSSADGTVSASTFQGNHVAGSTTSTVYTHVRVARLGSDNATYSIGSLYVTQAGTSVRLDVATNGTTIGTANFGTNFSHTGTITGSKVYGAVWNDYAEYRSQNEELKPGYITYCDNDGKLKYTTERLQKFEGVVSDTFGFAIGETDDCKTPLAVSGRALVYCNPEDDFHSGDCVCAGPDGLAYRMTREEIIQFPDRIVGIVSEIPTYETWGTGNVEVNGRIWVKVR